LTFWCFSSPVPWCCPGGGEAGWLLWWCRIRGRHHGESNVSAVGVSPNTGSALLHWDRGQLCGGLNKVQLMEELDEEGRPAWKYSERRVETRGCTRTAVKGFADAVFPAETGGCCAGAAVLRGREGGKQGAGCLKEKPGNKSGLSKQAVCSLAEETGRRYCFQAEGPGQASLHCQSSGVASKPSTDSSSTCHQTATANAATRCKCH